ncbi:MAG: major facilitator superfamily 1 [Candidatus Saccharibacteria bacterium]|jgi:fucose permease|nr:major facilitator superfamily 1 [Candidatus Saccharibacteria bacterium]
MPVLLLVVIYLTFISLGLPDAVFGGAWPAIYPALNANVGIAGALTAVATVGTLVSTLGASNLSRKFGVGLLVALSTLLTAIGLIGLSQADHIAWFFLWMIPIGFGGGAIDAALNNYVATHYQAHHMNWMHACWGIGAGIGPIIFALSYAQTQDWHTGFTLVAAIQFALVVILLVAVPLWAKVRARKAGSGDTTLIPDNWRIILGNRRVWLALFSFLFYVSAEIGTGFWAATYAVTIQHIPVAQAAALTGIYFGSIGISRIVCGFLVMKLSNELMIRAGILIGVAGIALFMAGGSFATSVLGLALAGAGFAPVFPGMIHETPRRFGAASSQKLISLQMAFGYTCGLVILPLLGLVAAISSATVVFAVVLALLAGLLFTTEKIKHQY